MAESLRLRTCRRTCNMSADLPAPVSPMILHVLDLGACRDA